MHAPLLEKRPRVQAKLRVNAPNDAFEREADRMADRVVGQGTSGETKHNFNAFMQFPVSRKCAACEAEDEKPVQRMHEEDEEASVQRKEDEEDIVQAKSADGGFSVDSGFESQLNARKGGGAPLDDNVRGQMERGFGADFGGVRIHTGGEAAGLSRQINAKAFTHGNDVFFGAGEYQPQTAQGKRLLAHELTHTIQQGGAEVQREGDDGPFEELLNKLTYFDIPEDDVIRLIGQLSDIEAGVLIDNEWAKGRMMSALDNYEMYRAMRRIPAVSLHKRLRWMLDEGTESKYVSNVVIHRPASELAEVRNDSDMMEELRDLMNYDKEISGNDVTVDLPGQLMNRDSMCGPDITTELWDVVDDAGTLFSGWNNDEKEDHCLALVSIHTGDIAWDINELYNQNHGWILGYRPECATSQFRDDASGSDELCGNTVEVDGECFYAGSPNYVIFGKMMKLCFDHYVSKRDFNSALDFTKGKVKNLVWLYKSGSANYEASRDFAVNAYDNDRSSPFGDRNGCYPGCTKPLVSGDGNFTVRWSSYEEER